MASSAAANFGGQNLHWGSEVQGDCSLCELRFLLGFWPGMRFEGLGLKAAAGVDPNKQTDREDVGFIRRAVKAIDFR